MKVEKGKSEIASKGCGGCAKPSRLEIKMNAKRKKKQWERMREREEARANKKVLKPLCEGRNNHIGGRKDRKSAAPLHRTQAEGGTKPPRKLGVN